MPELSARQIARLVLSERARQAVEVAEAMVSAGLLVGGGELDLVAEALALRTLVENVVAQAVIYERQRGTTWAQIGSVMGVTRQSAFERYRLAEQQWLRTLQAGGGSTDASAAVQAVVANPTEYVTRVKRWQSRRNMGDDGASLQ